LPVGQNAFFSISMSIDRKFIEAAGRRYHSALQVCSGDAGILGHEVGLVSKPVVHVAKGRCITGIAVGPV
jgi:hypothetical protein